MRPPPTAKAPSPSHNAWALRAPARVPLYPGDLDLRLYLSIEVARSYRFKRGSRLPVRVPVIEMVEIGTGGGSIAGADDLERIHVGPESAGSEPGPAAYGRVGRAGSHAGRGGKGREVVPPGHRIVMATPGGGGPAPPCARGRSARVCVTVEAAARDDGLKEDDS